jgi:hypothetical protein
MSFDLSSMHIIESLQPELETLKMQQCIYDVKCPCGGMQQCSSIKLVVITLDKIKPTLVNCARKSALIPSLSHGDTSMEGCC